jgi:phage terminase Nu1 subunit (DNA packaging protein)
MILTAAEVAAFFGVDRRTVSNWLNESPAIPSWKDGKVRKFDSVAVTEWRDARVGETRRIDSTLDEARIRKLTAEAALAELELAERERLVVSIDEMERLLSAPLYRLRAQLLVLPSKWAPALVGCRTIADAQTRLEAAVSEAMLTLAETGDDDGDEDDDAGGA